MENDKLSYERQKGSIYKMLLVRNHTNRDYMYYLLVILHSIPLKDVEFELPHP